jgi:hypothetical protein
VSGRPGPPPIPESARPAGAGRYGWAVGVLVLAILVYISLNTLRTSGPRNGVPVGERLPPFAVPLLASTLTGDANIARHPGQGAGRSGRVTACEVRDPRALNLCRAAAGHPVVLAFVSIQQGLSIRQLDTMARLAPHFPGVRFLAVFLRGDRTHARHTAARHRWRFPLGWDRHGDVAAVYGVKALPSITFADRRRRSRGSVYDYLGPAALARRVRGLGPA